MHIRRLAMGHLRECSNAPGREYERDVPIYFITGEYYELAPDLHETIWSNWWATRILPPQMLAAFEHACSRLQAHYLESGREWKTYNQEKRVLLARAMVMV